MMRSEPTTYSLDLMRWEPTLWARRHDTSVDTGKVGNEP